MSPQPTLFEGSSLQPLLEQINQEAGSDAKIVRAERSRQGGVMGFFARQHFRLEVEVRDEECGEGREVFDLSTADAASYEADGTAEGAFETGDIETGLVDAVDIEAGDIDAGDIETGLVDAVDIEAGDVEAGDIDAGDIERGDPERAGAHQEDPFDVFASLADATTDSNEVGGFYQSGAEFEDVLQRVASGLGSSPGDDAAAGDADIRNEIEQYLDHSAPLELPAPGNPARHRRTAAVKSWVDEDDAFDLVGADLFEPRGKHSMRDRSSLRAERVVTANKAHAAIGQALAAPHLDPTRATETALVCARSSEEAPAPLDPANVADRLWEAGLDESMAQSIRDGMETGRALGELLVEAFESAPLPPPLPRLAGSVVAIVGDKSRARSVAASLADGIGGDPSEVAVVSARGDRSLPPQLVARSSSEAAERCPGWRRSSVAVIAVDSPLGRRSAWGREVLASMRPTAVWGVVEATTKPEDVSTWASALGGIDALVVEGVERTVSPAAVLAAGIPVALIDERPATAQRWAAAVEEVLSRAEAPAWG